MENANVSTVWGNVQIPGDTTYNYIYQLATPGNFYGFSITSSDPYVCAVTIQMTGWETIEAGSGPTFSVTNNSSLPAIYNIVLLEVAPAGAVLASVDGGAQLVQR